MELKRDVVKKRIADSRQLRKTLSVRAKLADGEHTLYQCINCAQQWQGSRAWNWGNEEYLFRIPSVDPALWLENIFVQPDELLIYGAAMSDLVRGGNLVSGTSVCRVVGCGNNAIDGLTTCMHHHVLALQASRQLPSEPTGRWFEPYVRDAIVPAF